MLLHFLWACLGCKSQSFNIYLCESACDGLTLKRKWPAADFIISRSNFCGLCWNCRKYIERQIFNPNENFLFWYHYVDDIITCVPKNRLTNLQLLLIFYLLSTFYHIWNRKQYLQLLGSRNELNTRLNLTILPTYCLSLPNLTTASQFFQFSIY